MQDPLIEVDGDTYTLHLPPSPDGPRPHWLIADEDAFMHRLRDHPQYVSCSGPAGARYELTFNSRIPAASAMATPEYIQGFITATALAIGFIASH